MKTLFLIVLSVPCFAQINQKFKENKIDTIQLTQWQVQQIEMVEQEKKRLTEQVNLMLQTVIDTEGIDLNKVESVQIVKGKLIVKRKEEL